VTATSPGAERRARPKADVPPLTVLVDTREQCVPPWPAGVVVERTTLKEGDYTTPALRTIAVIERKSVCDFASTLSWHRERFDREVQRLQPYKHKCIVVEGDITTVYRSSAMHPNAVIGSIASLYARWDVPTLFVGNEAGCGRLIAGLLRRWQERLAGQGEDSAIGLALRLERQLPAACEKTDHCFHCIRIRCDGANDVLRTRCSASLG